MRSLQGIIGVDHEGPYHLRLTCPCQGCAFRMMGWVQSGSARLGTFFKHRDRVFLCPDCRLHGHMVALDWT